MTEKRQVRGRREDPVRRDMQIPIGVSTYALPIPARQRQGGLANSSGYVEGVYIISVAARILEMHPQTLRKYERVGLVQPSRTIGMLRLYSEQDIARLRLIKHLVEDVGMNLAGVEFVLGLFNRLLEARSLIAAIQEANGLPQSVRQELHRLLGLLDLTPDGPY